MRNDEELERLVRSKDTIEDMIIHSQTALEHDEYFKSKNVDRDVPVYSDAVLMQLGQIGEACSASKLPDETCDEYEHIDWGDKSMASEILHIISTMKLIMISSG